MLWSNFVAFGFRKVSTCTCIWWVSSWSNSYTFYPISIGIATHSNKSEQWLMVGDIKFKCKASMKWLIPPHVYKWCSLKDLAKKANISNIGVLQNHATLVRCSKNMVFIQKCFKNICVLFSFLKKFLC